MRGFEPRIGLCADSSEPGACLGFCVSLALCPSPAHALSLSKINKHLKSKQTNKGKGTWVAQLVKYPTLDFSSGHDLTVHEIKLHIRLFAVSTDLASDPLSHSLSALPPLAFSLSLKNK